MNSIFFPLKCILLGLSNEKNLKQALLHEENGQTKKSEWLRP